MWCGTCVDQSDTGESDFNLPLCQKLRIFKWNFTILEFAVDNSPIPKLPVVETTLESLWLNRKRWQSSIQIGWQRVSYHGPSALCPCLPTTGLKVMSVGPQPGHRAKEKKCSVGQIHPEVWLHSALSQQRDMTDSAVSHQPWQTWWKYLFPQKWKSQGKRISLTQRHLLVSVL